MDNTSNVVEVAEEHFARWYPDTAWGFDALCNLLTEQRQKDADTIERLRAELAEAYENAAKVAVRRGAEVSEAAKDCGRDYLHDVETVEQRCAYGIAEGIRAMIAAAEGGE